MKFDGIEATNRNILGKFIVDVSIDGMQLNLDIDIVPDHYTGYNIIMGRII